MLLSLFVCSFTVINVLASNYNAYSIIEVEGWCYSELNEYLGQTSTYEDCWDVCQSEFDNIVAIDYYTNTNDCYCQDDCSCIEKYDSSGVLLIDNDVEFPEFCDSSEGLRSYSLIAKGWCASDLNQRLNGFYNSDAACFEACQDKYDDFVAAELYPTRRCYCQNACTCLITTSFIGSLIVDEDLDLPSNCDDTGTPTFEPTPGPTPPTYKPTYHPTPRPTMRPTMRPTSKPTAKPTSTPTANPTSRPPSERPTSPPTHSPSSVTITVEPTTVPTLSGYCEDDDDWHKNGDPSKDCDWVSGLLKRCEVKGEDGTMAYEKCLSTCGCDGLPPIDPTISPSTILTIAPSTTKPTVQPTSSPTTLLVVSAAVAVDVNIDSEEVRLAIFNAVSSLKSIDQITITGRAALSSRRRHLLEDGVTYDRVDFTVIETRPNFLDELKSAVSSGALDDVVESTLSLELLNQVFTTQPSTSPTGGSGGGGSGGDGATAIVISVVIAIVVLLCLPLAYWFYRHRTASPAQKIPRPIVNVTPLEDEEDENIDDLKRRASKQLLAKLDSYQLRASRRVFDFEKNHVRWAGDNSEVAWLVRDMYSTSGDVCLVAAAVGVDVKVSTSDEVRSALQETHPSRAPFDSRMQILRKSLDRLRIDWTKGRVNISVRRNAIAADAYDQLCELPAERWSQPFFISFVNEAALDAGGVSREFFCLLIDELLNVSYGLFRYGAGYTYQLADDRDSSVQFGGNEKNRDARYTFVGRILGKIILEGHMISAHPAMPLLKHIVTEPIKFENLQALDYDYWKSLNDLTMLDADQVESLALTFSIAYEHFGEHIERELIPGGKNIAVTGNNVRQFIELRLKDRVCDVHKRGLSALLRGIYDVVPPDLLMLLSARELELALCGIPDIDVNEWRNSCQYGGEFKEQKEEHPVVRFFWEIVSSWPNEKKAQLLQWCTGTASVPVQGFEYLQGRDGVIRKFQLTSIGIDQAIYPRAHTCFNRIDLPLFDLKSELEDALDFVILTNSDEAIAGFSMD